MDKSPNHKHIETMVFGTMIVGYHTHNDALEQAEHYRLVRSLPKQQRTMFRPVRNRLGQWMVSVGTSLQRQGFEVNPDVLSRALRDVLDGKEPAMTEADARQVLQAYNDEHERSTQPGYEPQSFPDLDYDEDAAEDAARP